MVFMGAHGSEYTDVYYIIKFDSAFSRLLLKLVFPKYGLLSEFELIQAPRKLKAAQQRPWPLNVPSKFDPTTPA